MNPYRLKQVWVNYRWLEARARTQVPLQTGGSQRSDVYAYWQNAACLAKVCVIDMYEVFSLHRGYARGET